LSVESGTSEAPLTSGSDRAEPASAVTVSIDNKVSGSSYNRSLTDLSDVGQVDSETDRDHPSSSCCVNHNKTESTSSEPVQHADTDSSDQLVDSEVCEELMLLTDGNVDVHLSDADSEQLSQQLNANTQVYSSSMLSDADQSQLDHTVISSTLKNIAQNEDHGLVYIVCSKPSEEC